MISLLTSVRNIEEARVVAVAGTDWIDLKEPRLGALGAVPYSAACAVVAELGGSLPVSATIGDCWECPDEMPPRVAKMAATGVSHIKIGLYAQRPDLSLLRTIERCVAVAGRVILVCFAEAPPDRADIRRLAATGVVGVMLDTAKKASANLLELLAPVALEEFVQTARSERLLCGLAGSLRLEDIPRVASYRPDYLGFRGALCRQSERGGDLEPAAVLSVRAALSAVAASAPLSSTLSMARLAI